jgi:tetratricopeptide (TPR) repeat protein
MGMPAPHDASAQPDPPERRDIRTDGGDYAEHNIDKRQGMFVDRYVQAPRDVPPAFQVPYPPISLVGRDEALAELATLLTGAAPIALTPAIAGLGGVGKTMLAATFAYHHQADFPGGVFWLNMEEPDQIAGQVAACAGPGGLDLPDFGGLSHDERIARVQAAWNSPVRRLLVLDNLEDPAVLTRWQPTGSGTRVLITTRRDDWPRQVQRLQLPVLPRPQSIELLLGAKAADQGVPSEALLTDEAERTAANAICDLLGDLPLALAIAAALLRLHPSLRLRELQAQITADPLFAASTESATMHAVLREAGLPTRRERGVVATFAISYQQLQPTTEQDDAARRVLHAAAYCAPSAIPEELLWQVVGLDPTSQNDRMAGDAMIRRLRALGLVVYASGDNAATLTLHRLLAAFVRQQPHPSEILNITVDMLTAYTYAMQEAGQIKRSLALVPHVEAVLEHQTAARGTEHPDTLSTVHNLANTLRNQGDYAGARERYEMVLEAYTRLLGAEHSDTLGTAMGLANTLDDQGDYAGARERYEMVLEAYTRLLGAEHPDTLGTAHNLAVTLRNQGDYAGARERYEMVLEARTRLLGAEHPDTLRTAHNLAVTLYSQGDYAGARERYEMVLEAYTRLLGAEHPDTLGTAHNLALTLDAQGDYAGARERYEMVLEAYTRLLGAEHPDTLRTAHNLAVTLRNQGDYAGARERYEMVLAARTRLLGAEHPDTLGTAMGLANTLRNQGDYAGARERYEMVLEAYTRLLGAEHPDTLRTAHNLANTLSKQGDYAGARERYEMVLEARTRLLGAEHPDTLRTAHNLANTLLNQGDYARARERYATVLAAQTRVLGAEHPDTLLTAKNLALLEARSKPTKRRWWQFWRRTDPAQ